MVFPDLTGFARHRVIKTKTYLVNDVRASSTLSSMAANLIVGMVVLSSWLRVVL